MIRHLAKETEEKILWSTVNFNQLSMTGCTAWIASVVCDKFVLILS